MVRRRGREEGRAKALRAVAEKAAEGEGARKPGTGDALVATVPQGAIAGETQIRVDPGTNHEHLLVLTVPEGAKPGDSLILTEGADGEWECAVEGGEGSGGSVSKSAQKRAAKKEQHAQGAGGAAIGAGQKGKGASKGAGKHSKAAAQPKWRVKEPATEPEARLPSGDGGQENRRVVLAYLQHDSEAIYRGTVEAARDAGAEWSTKLTRGAVPPLCVQGLLAAEPIAKGEVLCRLPSRLLLTPRTGRIVIPKVFDTIEALPGLVSATATQGAHALFVATLLKNALLRSREDTEQCDSRFHKLWHRYAEALLAENFDAHPYCRSLFDRDGFCRQFEPSAESELALGICTDVFATFDRIVDDASLETLGTHIDSNDSGLFLQAWLCLLSREFDTPHGSALVPVVDFFNHSHVPGVEQRWDPESDSFVVVALRDHDAGEEVFITYGSTLSNPLLYRTYGFAVPPSEEPSWTCTFVAEEVEKFLGDLASSELICRLVALPNVHLDSSGPTDTLINVLQVCYEAGVDPAALLRELCTRKRELYEQDILLTPALAALARARAVDKSACGWWSELLALADSPAVGEQEALRVKMSEYLCLTAHVEALGETEMEVESLFLARAKKLRAGLHAGMRTLWAVGFWPR